MDKSMAAANQEKTVLSCVPSLYTDSAGPQSVEEVHTSGAEGQAAHSQTLWACARGGSQEGISDSSICMFVKLFFPTSDIKCVDTSNFILTTCAHRWWPTCVWLKNAWTNPWGTSTRCHKWLMKSRTKWVSVRWFIWSCMECVFKLGMTKSLGGNKKKINSKKKYKKQKWKI